MNKMIREEIKRRLKNGSVLKSDWLNVVAHVCDCSTNDVQNVYSEMKSKEIIYFVDDVPKFLD